MDDQSDALAGLTLEELSVKANSEAELVKSAYDDAAEAMSRGLVMRRQSSSGTGTRKCCSTRATSSRASSESMLPRSGMSGWSSSPGFIDSIASRTARRTSDIVYSIASAATGAASASKR